MIRFLAIALSLLAGCTLFHGDNGDRVLTGKGSGSGDDGFGDDGCSNPGGPPQIQLLNPVTLACEAHSIGSECNPSTCPSCPDFVDAGSLPNWAPCGSTCLGLSESLCATTPGCRVTREAGHYYGTTAGDSFLGCFPANLQPPDGEPECMSLDAYACSSLSRCNSVYDAPAGVQCGIEHAEGCSNGNFVACVNQTSTLPGRCGPDFMSTCVSLPPACPAGTQPGINDDCYTGICIPQQYCSSLPF
ncbi:MAG TPA: hypothetical protein VGM90_25530 [Kofleriaceae bacterium]|jgi:hypothetical protein